MPGRRAVVHDGTRGNPVADHVIEPLGIDEITGSSYGSRGSGDLRQVDAAVRQLLRHFISRSGTDDHAELAVLRAVAR